MRIVVLGTPAGQGSKRHVGHGVMIESSKKTRPWREHVHQAALDVTEGHARPCFPTGSMQARLIFYFNRPRSHYGTGRNADVLRPTAPAFPDTRATFDIDKLVRACFDSLTSAGVWRDDAQVAVVTAGKCYTDSDALAVPGVVIDVEPLTSAGAA